MAAAGPFEDYQAKLGPPTFVAPECQGFQAALGAEKDLQQSLARQAVLADIPGQQPTGAVDLIADDRMLPRAVGEADVDLAERLRTSWDSLDGHPRRGSHRGLHKALARAGFPTGLASGAVIVQRTKRYSYMASGVVTYASHAGWTFDGHGPEVWNQFGIMFGADVVGLDVGTPMAELLNGLVDDWRPAKARFMGTRIFISGTFWGWPLGVTWGAGGRVWASGVSRFIPPP